MFFLKTSLAAIVFALVVILHISFAFILPRPISNLNIFVLALIIWLFIFETGYSVWISFFMHFILELYVTSTPFGVVLTAGTASMLIVYWLYHQIIVNRTWYGCAVLTFFFIILFRIIYLSIVAAVSLLSAPIPIYWSDLIVNIGWESAITSAAAGILYYFIWFWRPVKNRRAKIV